MSTLPTGVPFPEVGHSTSNISEPKEEDDFYLYDRRDVRAIFISLYTLVFVVCFFGNLLVIVVVMLSRRMRSITNFFLANLAIADLCVGVFCVYQNLSIYLVQSWVLGEMVCKLYHFVHNLSYTASIFILVVVCVERYLAIIHPMTCRTILTPRRLKAAGVAVWLLSAGVCGSRLYWAQTITVELEDSEEIICISNRHKYDQRLYDIICFLLLYLTPLLVMSVLYSRTVAVLWSSGMNLGHPQPAARRGVIKLVVAVVCAFAVCHLPLHGRRLWQHWSPWYHGPSTFSAIFTPVTFLIAYANSAANPLLYALLSHNFRAVIKDMLMVLRNGPRPLGSLRSLSRTTAITELPSMPRDICRDTSVRSLIVMPLEEDSQSTL